MCSQSLVPHSRASSAFSRSTLATPRSNATLILLTSSFGRISCNEVDANNELYKKLQRRLWNKIERRLTQCKTSSLRLLYRSNNAAPNLDQLSNHVQNGLSGEHFQVQSVEGHINALTMSNSHFIQFQTYIDQNIVHYDGEFEKIIRQGWNGT